MADSRTNRRRRWLWLFFLPVAVGVTAFFLSRWERGLNIAQCNRVRAGMKRQQVEHILGGPPGDYATRPVASLDFHGGVLALESGRNRSKSRWFCFWR
jgi:hypothetical protein